GWMDERRRGHSGKGPALRGRRSVLLLRAAVAESSGRDVTVGPSQSRSLSWRANDGVRGCGPGVQPRDPGDHAVPDGHLGRAEAAGLCDFSVAPGQARGTVLASRGPEAV